MQQCRLAGRRGVGQGNGEAQVSDQPGTLE